MVLLSAGGGMAPYSMDLRTRVLRDSDAGLSSKELAAKYAVSRAWVDRVKQRRRETGEIAPRKQTKVRRRTLSAQQEHRLVFLITARPGDVGGNTGAASDSCRLEHPVARDRALGHHG